MIPFKVNIDSNFCVKQQDQPVPSTENSKKKVSANL